MARGTASHPRSTIFQSRLDPLLLACIPRVVTSEEESMKVRFGIHAAACRFPVPTTITRLRLRRSGRPACVRHHVAIGFDFAEIGSRAPVTEVETVTVIRGNHPAAFRQGGPVGPESSEIYLRRGQPIGDDQR
jgi:hypothetical protein